MYVCMYIYIYIHLSGSTAAPSDQALAERSPRVSSMSTTRGGGEFGPFCVKFRFSLPPLRIQTVRLAETCGMLVARMQKISELRVASCRFAAELSDPDN